MQVRKYPVFAVMALALLAFAGNASAASADYKGWFGTLDLGLAQPNSLDQHYANHIDDSGGTTEVNPLTLDNDSDLAWKLAFGYSWGKQGSLQVSYWTFDNDDDESDTLNGGVYPTIFGYSYGYGGFYPYDSTGLDVTAESSVEATTLDVDYVRPIAVGDKFTVKWLAGLRVATYEEEVAVDIEDSGYHYINEKSWESDAFGFRVGAAANWAFTDMFSLEGNITLSFLQADTSGESAQITDFPLGSDTEEVRSIEDDNVRGEMRDYGLKAIWDVGPVDVWVGYQMSNWDGLVTDPLPANEGGHFAQGPSAHRDRDSISFNSWNVGATWRFGGQ